MPNRGNARNEAIKIFELLRSHKWSLLAFVLAGAAVALIYVTLATPIFRATVTVLIEPGKSRIVSIDDVGPTYDQSQAVGYYQTQMELMKSVEVAERTVRALRLWERPEFNSALAPESWLARIKRSIFGTGPAPASAVDDTSLIADAVGAFLPALKVDSVGLSQLVRISFDSPDRKFAPAAANQQAEEYIRAERDSRLAIANQAGTFIKDRLAVLGDKLSQSERALQAYRDQKGIASLAGSNQTVAGLQVGGTNERLMLATSRRAELEGAYRQLSSAGGDFSEIPEVMRDKSVVDALGRVLDARRRLAELSQTLGPQNVRVQQVEAELAQGNMALRQQRTAAAASLKREYDAARNTELALQRELANARQSAQLGNREEFQLAALERDVQANKDLYNVFLTRSKELSLATEVQGAVARITDRARETQYPVRPAKSVIVLGASFGAFILALGILLIREALFKKVKTPEDVEDYVGLEVLAAVPSIPKRERAHLSRSFLNAPFSRHAESIRTAHSGVMLSGTNASHRVILVTSAMPGEGKTTIACNLALSHAQNQRTLLIDADMRRSRASRRLGITASVKGLTNLIAGDAEVRELVHVINGSPLFIMPVGNLIPGNPFDLLISKQFRTAIAALSDHFDVIVIDSPPVELVSDALAIAPVSTTTVLVIKADDTSATQVRKASTKLRRNGASQLVAILNAVNLSGGRTYGYYDSPVEQSADSLFVQHG